MTPFVRRSAQPQQHSLFESAAVAQRTCEKVLEIAESATGFAAVFAHACYAVIVFVLVIFAFLLVSTERTLRDKVCPISHPFHLFIVCD
jgi:hypothetical protein